MAGPNYDLHGAVDNPEQEQRWRTESFAAARAERARQVMRRRELLDDSTPAVIERAA
jgi:hypothetical protein